MGEAKAKQTKDAELEAQMAKLSPRFVELASTMQNEGSDPSAIVEAALTVATAQMLVVRGPERTAHALKIAAGGITAATEASQQPGTSTRAH